MSVPRFLTPAIASRLFALVIGVDYYAKIKDQLYGAVADADAIEWTLLRNDVPQNHITNLRSRRPGTANQNPTNPDRRDEIPATRDDIIASLRALKDDPNIPSGSPILIFFAGHGSHVDAPDGWGAQGGQVQLLLAQDVKDGTIIENEIADRTMGMLLEDLSRAKETNNITVIFDCCHSHSGTRRPDAQVTDDRIRFAELKGSLAPQIHSGGSSSNKGGVRNPFEGPIFLYHGLSSHVLLAACSSDETAKETTCSRGAFTVALLEALAATNGGQVSYTDLMALLPRLYDQNPHCEGKHKGRLLFSTHEPDNSFICVKKDGTLMAGEAHGITTGSRFKVYAQRDSSQPLGTFCVAKIKPTEATLTSADDTPPVLSNLAYARLEHYVFPVEDRLKVHFSEQFGEDVVSNTMKSANAGLGIDSEHSRFVRTEESAAILLVTKECDRAVFKIRTMRPHGDLVALDSKFNQEAGSAKAISTVLRDVGHWNWLLRRQGSMSTPVSLEFFRVRNVDDGYEGKIWEQDKNSDDTFVIESQGNGVIDIKADPKHRYGMKIVNNTSHGLHAYLYYLDVKSQAIHDFQLGSVGKDVPLLPGSFLPVGYGASGGNPLKFEFPENVSEENRPGFFKIFLTTSSTISASITQISPFKGTRVPVRNSPEWFTFTVGAIERFPT